MENDQFISREKVINEFDRRARLHGDLNAVLDASDKPGISRQNILRDYFTKRTLLKRLNPVKTDIILDFGCGVGRMVRLIKPKVFEIAGVDVSQPMLDLACSDNPGKSTANLKLLSNNTIPFPDQYFSKIFTVWVLQHISDEELSIIAQELFRVLKPGGTLVLLEQTRTVKKILSEIHIHRTVQDYIKLFENAGYTLVQNRPAMRVPSYAMSAWNKNNWLTVTIMPLLYFLEKITLNYKIEYIEYYTWSFVFKKI